MTLLMNIKEWTARFGENAASTALLLRPNIPYAPKPVRSVLEPIVAGVALAVLVCCFAWGMFGFATLLLASGLMYLVLTQVFGLDLDVEFPLGR